jgi:hypothetical protein
VKIIIAAFICLLMFLLYLLRLMADGRRLRERVRERSIEFSEDAFEGEKQLIKLGAMWTSPHLSQAGTAGGAYDMQFCVFDIGQRDAEDESGQSLHSTAENPSVRSSEAPAPTKSGRKAF